MTNKPVFYIFAVILLTGTAAAYSWTTMIDNILNDLYCRNCTLDNPTFVNFSFNNSTGSNFSLNLAGNTNLSTNATLDCGLSMICSQSGTIISLDSTGGGTTNHAALSNLNWLDSGHIIDTDLNINGYNISQVNQVGTVSIFVDSLTPNKTVCSNEYDDLISCDISIYNSTYNSLIPIVSSLISNDSYQNDINVYQNSAMMDLQNNDTIHYIPYPRYNSTDLNASGLRKYNTGYTNTNTYPIQVTIRNILTNSVNGYYGTAFGINGVGSFGGTTQVIYVCENTNMVSYQYRCNVNVVISPGDNYTYGTRLTGTGAAVGNPIWYESPIE